MGCFFDGIAYSIRRAVLLVAVPDPLPRVFRKPWLATGLFVVTFTVLYSSSDGMAPVSWLFVGAAGALGVVVLIRFGVLALITLDLVRTALEFPITADLSAWYARDGLLALAFVLALALSGFWISLDRRALGEG
jgi:hypothetical protein